jgi:hypothetical protein
LKDSRKTVENSRKQLKNNNSIKTNIKNNSRKTIETSGKHMKISSKTVEKQYKTI